MSDMMIQASQTILQNVRARTETMSQIAGEAIDRNERRNADLIQRQTPAQQIMQQGLRSRGGLVDIQV